jgi:hypothetical protein
MCMASSGAGKPFSEMSSPVPVHLAYEFPDERVKLLNHGWMLFTFRAIVVVLTVPALVYCACRGAKDEIKGSWGAVKRLWQQGSF